MNIIVEIKNGKKPFKEYMRSRGVNLCPLICGLHMNLSNS